jgi:hypothetical protein
MAPKFGNVTNPDEENVRGAGSTTLKRTPPALKQTELDRSYADAVKWLNKEVGTKDENYKGYKTMLDTLKRSAKGDADTFTEGVETIKKHLELKQQIADEFGDDAAVRKQLLYDLSLSWKKFAKSPSSGADIYSDMEASVARQVEKKTVSSAGEAAGPTLNEGERLSLSQQEGLKTRAEETDAQKAGLFLDVYRVAGSKDYRMDICQATEDGRNVMGSISMTQAGLDQLLQLSKVPADELKISKVGDRYELAYDDKRVMLDKTTMAAVLAGGKTTLNEFDAEGRPTANTEEAKQQAKAAQATRFTECAQQVHDEAGKAPERQEGLQTQKPKKKNFLEQILEWLSLILNAFMMWTGLNRMFQLTGITKKGDNSSSDLESEAQGMYYTMNTLNSTYNQFQNNLDRVKGGKGSGLW